MNRIQISGRLTADPELRQTADNISVVSFCVATPRPNVKDKTDFIYCTAFRAAAENIKKYFSKGKPIEIGGTLVTTDREKDGVKFKGFGITVDWWGFVLTDKAAEHSAPAEPPKPAEKSEAAETIGNLADYEEMTFDENKLPF